MDICEKELRTLLKNFILEKKQGKLDLPEKFDNQDTKWRNVIDYGLLWNCIKHRCPQIRRDVLELLVVSKKSTQRFTRIEYQLIEKFLIYNLGEKIELRPLIKKAVKRTKDSFVVLQREILRLEKARSLHNENVCLSHRFKDPETLVLNIAAEAEIRVMIGYYESFLTSLRNICINNLYPTANYERRHSSLYILCQIQDIFDDKIVDLKWNKNHATSLFNCLLLDTYECNKDMAYKILKPMPLCFLKLDERDAIGEIIRTALNLGNSIRPIDSATAAYIFKVCLASPVIVKHVISQTPEFMEFEAPVDKDVHLTLVILLISQLKKPLEIARESIVKAASMHSLYGYLSCLHSLISDRFCQKISPDNGWKEVISDLVDMCFDLNEVVGQIVNNSSPEGHLPMDLDPRNLRPSLFGEELSEYEKITTPQMVLLCSWRTVKEVSLLFGYLTANLPIDGINGAVGLLTEKQVHKIGEHFVTLLSETKHRGAFEQAHVGFGQLCRRLWNQPNDSILKQLPKTWLLQLLLAVTGLSPRDSKLCATRRSAGVPFMVQALLTSEELSNTVIKHGGSFTFHSTMRILLGLASLKDDRDLEAKMISLIYKDTAFSQFQGLICTSDETQKYTSDSNEKNKSYRLAEIKTHVINILRALFRHCQLGECVKPYIADGVISAIKSYNGKTWAERNAATLLFSALVVRIFGVQRTKDHLNLSVHNRMTGKVFFERYPTLLTFMYAELEEFVKPGDTLIRPGVQSVLLLLSRLYPGCHDNAHSNWKMADFIAMVSKCAESQVYETRELAARALLPLLTEATAPTTFSTILETISKESPNYSNINMIHGYILQTLQIAKSPQFATFQQPRAQLIDFVRSSLWILEKLEHRTYGVGISFPLAASYLDTLLEIYRVNGQWLYQSIQEEGIDLFYKIRLHLVRSSVLGNGPGKEIYEIAAAKFLTFWYMIGNNVHNECFNADDSIKGNSMTTGWTPLLYHNNIDVRIIAWIKSTELVGGSGDSSFREAQLREAIYEVDKAVKESIDDHSLEGAIFEFLYAIFTNFTNGNPLRIAASSFPHLVENSMAHLSNKLHNPDYYVRDSFLRLLGAAYGEISNQSQDMLSSGDKEAIFDLFLKNSWMDSSDNDCRLAVSQTIHNLYQPAMENHEYFVIYWWTILLNLLVDDDKTVRQHAAAVVCKVNTQTEVVCDAEVRRIFFDKFLNIVAKSHPDLAIVALFSWGAASWREENYEMDDTDVFNKCRNYDSFEQLEISNLCLTLLTQIAKNYSFDVKLRSPSLEWLRKLYDCQSTFTTLREFVKIHEKCIPVLGDRLDDCLDPTYRDKLQQVIAFKQFADLISGKSNGSVE